MPHKCPKDGCNRVVQDDVVACYEHRYWVPKKLRRRALAAYRRGERDVRQIVIREAIALLNEP